MKKIKLELLKGNQGYVICLNETRLTPTRHNGIMNVINSCHIDVQELKNIIKEFEEGD